MNPTNEQIIAYPEDIIIRLYLLSLIDEMDGCGLVVTDWDEIKTALKNKGAFRPLREMFEAK